MYVFRNLEGIAGAVTALGCNQMKLLSLRHVAIKLGIGTICYIRKPFYVHYVTAGAVEGNPRMTYITGTSHINPK